jgi:hypothetical protein
VLPLSQNARGGELSIRRSGDVPIRRAPHTQIASLDWLTVILLGFPGGALFSLALPPTIEDAFPTHRFLAPHHVQQQATFCTATLLEVTEVSSNPFSHSDMRLTLAARARS